MDRAIVEMFPVLAFAVVRAKIELKLTSFYALLFATISMSFELICADLTATPLLLALILKTFMLMLM